MARDSDMESCFKATIDMFLLYRGNKISKYHLDHGFFEGLKTNAKEFLNLYNLEHHSSLSLYEAMKAYNEERKEKYGNQIHPWIGR